MLHIQTIYACLLMVMFASALTMAVIWYRNPFKKSAGYWTITYALGVLAGVVLTVWMKAGSYTPLFSTVCNISAYIVFTFGFLAFNGQRVPKLILPAVIFVYLILAALFPPIYLNLSYSTALQAGFVAGISFFIAYLLLTGKGNRQLPIVPLATFVMAVHGLFRCAELVYMLGVGAPIIDGRMGGNVWPIFVMEIFLNTSLMAITTVVLIKDRLEQQHRIASETDSLTGISNRRAFVNQATDGLKTCTGKAAMAVIDLDHFKQVNDSFGHDAGDRILVDFTELVQTILPKDVLFGRMGGEEFALYSPNGGADFVLIADEIRLRIATHGFVFNGIRIPLTVSVGVALTEQVGECFDQIYAAADSALYVAKQEGRNRVELFNPSQRLHGLFERAKRETDQSVVA